MNLKTLLHYSDIYCVKAYGGAFRLSCFALVDVTVSTDNQNLILLCL